jgi:hypothetical protein
MRLDAVDETREDTQQSLVLAGTGANRPDRERQAIRIGVDLEGDVSAVRGLERAQNGELQVVGLLEREI